MAHRNRTPDVKRPGDFLQEPDRPFTERFRGGGSIDEGVSGCIRMGSTRFENTETRGEIAPPRSPDSDPAGNTQDDGLDSQGGPRYRY